jgi:hypothetical protein
MHEIGSVQVPQHHKNMTNLDILQFQKRHMQVCQVKLFDS